MKISIVIPVYNSQKFLKKLFDSIIKQNYDNYEVIFVNDGSLDNSENIIKKFISEDNRFKIVNQNNSGPGIARRNGFKKCDGDLIFFLDSDDTLPNEHVLDNIVKIFEKYNPDLLVFNRMEIYDHNITKIRYPLMNRTLKKGFNKFNEKELLDFSGGLGSKIFKNDILDEKMFIKSNNFEDFFTTYMYLDKCKTYYYLDENMYNINRKNENNNSLTTNIDFDKYLISFKIVNQCFLNLENEFAKKSLASVMSKMLIGFEKKSKILSKNEKNKLIPEIKILVDNISQYHDVYYTKSFFVIKNMIYRFLLYKYKTLKVKE